LQRGIEGDFPWQQPGLHETAKPLSIKEHIHVLNQEVRSISGWYLLEKEGTFPWAGQTVLYFVGNACVDASCCGMGGCRYALVPGFVHCLHCRQNPEGHWISEVVPIGDGKIRAAIVARLKEEELVSQVVFG